MDIQAALKDILTFMEAGGALALKNQKTAAHNFKADSSIVTETDLALTELAKKTWAHWFEDGTHTLVDEESLKDLATPEEVFATSEYQWVLDPVDGTSTYAAGLKHWSISLGILHNKQPFMGALYVPALGEFYLAYLKGGKWIGYQIENAFTEKAERIALPQTTSMHPQSQVHANWKYHTDAINFPFGAVYHWSTVSNLGWLAAGKLAGVCSRGCLWDVAGGRWLGTIKSQRGRAVPRKNRGRIHGSRRRLPYPKMGTETAVFRLSPTRNKPTYRKIQIN